MITKCFLVRDERLERTEIDYKKHSLKYDIIDFLNTLLERANIEIRLYLTNKNKHFHVYDYEESKVMFKTEEETLCFVLNECGLEMNTRTKEEENRLKDLNKRFLRKYIEQDKFSLDVEE